MTNNGKTIKQIAEEIGVSKQAVHQKRKGKGLSTALQSFTSTVDGVVYISVDGENLIKQAFLKEQPSTPSTNLLDGATELLIVSLQGQIGTLTEQNHDLREQLSIERTHSREKTDEIAELAKNLAALTNNAQMLHGESRGMLPSSVPPMKRMDHLKAFLTGRKNQ